MEEVTRSSSVKTPVRRTIHWHIFLAHFPVSLFAVCAGFQILHLFVLRSCLEIASNICFGAATLMLIPTTLAGRATWKSQYHGYGSQLFVRKITISYVMLALAVPILVWQIVSFHQFAFHMRNLYHWIYFSSTILLFGGAILEGYIGGTLHHR